MICSDAMGSCNSSLKPADGTKPFKTVILAGDYASEQDLYSEKILGCVIAFSDSQLYRWKAYPLAPCKSILGRRLDACGLFMQGEAAKVAGRRGHSAASPAACLLSTPRANRPFQASFHSETQSQRKRNLRLTCCEDVDIVQQCG